MKSTNIRFRGLVPFVSIIGMLIISSIIARVGDSQEGGFDEGGDGAALGGDGEASTGGFAPAGGFGEGFGAAGGGDGGFGGEEGGSAKSGGTGLPGAGAGGAGLSAPGLGASAPGASGLGGGGGDMSSGAMMSGPGMGGAGMMSGMDGAGMGMEGGDGGMMMGSGYPMLPPLPSSNHKEFTQRLKQRVEQLQKRHGTLDKCRQAFLYSLKKVSEAMVQGDQHGRTIHLQAAEQSIFDRKTYDEFRRVVDASHRYLRLRSQKRQKTIAGVSELQWTYAVDSDVLDLQIEESRLLQESLTHGEVLKAGGKDEELEELRASVAKHFKVRQELRNRQLAKMQQEIEELQNKLQLAKQRVQDREKQKDAIIEKRVQELSGRHLSSTF